MTTDIDLVDRLTTNLGADAIVAPEDRARYERGYRYGEGRAAVVVRPADTEAVRTVVRLCRSADRRIVIQGAHTGLTGAATPDAQGDQVVLSLERIRSVRVDAANRTATAGAGARLSSLNAAAAEHGLTLPIDLGADPSLGGMVAANTGGARLLRYGGMRRQVLGLEAVLADDDTTIVRDLAGLRKNNVGMDLKHLFVGSGGRAGIVTAVQVELQPVIRQSATAIAIPINPNRIPEIVSRLERDLDQFLTACEGMSGNAMRAALDSHPALRRPFDAVPPYALLIEVGTAIPPDSGIDVDAMLQRALMSCFDATTPLVSDVIVGRGGGFWAMRHAISDGLKSLGKVIGLDVAVRRDRLPSLREKLLALMARDFPALHVCDFGHVADGGMHFNIVIGRGTTLAPQDVARMRTALFDIVVNDFEGSFSAEHGIGPSNADAYARYRCHGDQRLIAMIETLTDPFELFR